MEEDDLASGELKRIDHLIHVTLKYTRTVDVIRSILEKFICAMDYKVADYHQYLIEKKKVKSFSSAPLMRIRMLEELHPKDVTIKNFIDFYVKIKHFYNAEYKAKEEYRKNVALLTKEKEINIQIIKEYAEEVKRYIDYIKSLQK